MSSVIQVTINGRTQQRLIADSLLLIDFLRDELALTGTKQGCDGGECGACTILVDGRPRLACITLAKMVDGRQVETIEAVSQDGRLSALQTAFHEKLGTQCGYCTPGMILAAQALLQANPSPTDAQIKTALSGNLCRCTGYTKIIEAVRSVAGNPEPTP